MNFCTVLPDIVVTLLLHLVSGTDGHYTNIEEVLVLLLVVKFIQVV